MKNVITIWFIIMLSAFTLAGCRGGDNGGTSDGVTTNGGTTTDISMITPYKNSSDMASINEAFSSTASAPWGFAHDGIDF